MNEIDVVIEKSDSNISSIEIIGNNEPVDYVIGTRSSSRQNCECGYHRYKKIHKVQDERKSVLMNDVIVKTTVGTPATSVTTVNVDNFFTSESAVSLLSKYHTTPIKTYVTNDGTRTWGISNMVINRDEGGPITIQFVAIDGSSLSEEEFLDPYYVILNYNLGNLPIINYTGAANGSNPTLDANKEKFDAYTGSLWMVKMLHDYFRRGGVFNKSTVFLSVLDVPYENAFWNGHYMTYGIFATNPTDRFTSIDIIGHESGHGVMDQIGSNAYHGEPGSINEANADVFGLNLRHYVKVNTIGYNPTPFNWTIGDQLYNPPLRDFTDPYAGNPPAAKFKYDNNWVYAGTTEDDGIYDNIGVIIYMYYLLAVGSGGDKTNHLGEVYNIAAPFVNIVDIFKMIYHTYPATRFSNEYKPLPYSGDINELFSTFKYNFHLFARDLNINKSAVNNLLEIATALKANITDYVAFNHRLFRAGSPYYLLQSNAPPTNQYQPRRARNIFNYVVQPNWHTYIPRKYPKFIPTN